MTSDDILQLRQPLTAGGIRSANFFNGRLLTGKDLTREQEARRAWDQRLGLAMGDGVAFGLDAVRDIELDAPAAPVLRVKAGLAVNRAGQALRLSVDTSVALTRRFEAAPTGACDCVFANCSPLASGTYVAGAGVYLLTIAPAQLAEGRAPSNGLDPTNVRCNTDVTVDGLQFRLLALRPGQYTDLDIASRQFRNRLAYRSFGIDARAANAADPWRSDPTAYGLVDELRATGELSDCDVPLALLYWTAVDGMRFIDRWAVRRALVAPDACDSLAFQARRRRLAEAEAMCQQFQQQLADELAASPSPGTFVAREVFRHLPPFGLVPLQSAALRGFGEPSFLAGLVRRPAAGAGQSTEFIDARLLGAVREQALEHGPIDTTLREFVWVFRPWQNVQAAGTVQPTLVFASGLLPHLAVARLDMARADYSNVAACCGDA